MKEPITTPNILDLQACRREKVLINTEYNFVFYNFYHILYYIILTT